MFWEYHQSESSLIYIQQIFFPLTGLKRHMSLVFVSLSNDTAFYPSNVQGRHLLVPAWRVVRMKAPPTSAGKRRCSASSSDAWWRHKASIGLSCVSLPSTHCVLPVSTMTSQRGSPQHCVSLGAEAQALSCLALLALSQGWEIGNRWLAGPVQAFPAP